MPLPFFRIGRKAHKALPVMRSTPHLPDPPPDEAPRPSLANTAPEAALTPQTTGDPPDDALKQSSATASSKYTTTLQTTDDPLDDASKQPLAIVPPRGLTIPQVPDDFPEEAGWGLPLSVMRAIEDHRQDDIFVGVIGTADSGLSRFLNSLAYCDVEDQDGPSEVRAIRLENHPRFGRRVVLIVPAYLDGTLRSERQALGNIQRWLDTHDAVQLHALCYLHPITSPRTPGVSLANLEHDRLFGGKPPSKQVGIVLTHLGDRGKDPRLDPFFGLLQEILSTFRPLGSQFHVLRENDGSPGAWMIVDALIAEGEKAECYSLNSGLTELEKELEKTSQGSVVLNRIQESLSSLRSSQDNMDVLIVQYICARELMSNEVSPALEMLEIGAGQQLILFMTRDNGRDSEDEDASTERSDQCRALVLEVTATASSRKKFVKLASHDAQTMVDYLAKLLDDPYNVRRSERKPILHLLDKLAKTSQMFPQCLELKGVQYDLTSPDAEGGYGLIYKATYDAKAVCVKAIRLHGRDDKNKRALRAHAGEIILWAHVTHQNILPFRGIYLSNEKVQRVCIVSQWMENGNLTQFLRKFPETPRIPLLHDIISGLHYLHGLDIVHADIKAQNVLVSAAKRAILADFGVSRVSMTLPTTTTSAGAGTAHWMAPELFLQQKPYPSRESDIWSFGCLCYEAVTGLVPFHQYTLVPLLIGAFSDGSAFPLKPTLNDEWDQKIWSLAEPCWNYDPKARPTSTALETSIVNFNFPDTRSVESEPWVIKRVHVKLNYESIRDILQEITSSSLDRCRVLLQDIIHSPASQRLLFESEKGDNAQIMVDFLDRLLDDSDIFSQFEKARTLSLFSRLAKLAGVFPKTLELKGVQCDLTHSVNEGGSGLIYKGIFEGKSVCVKAVRVHSHDRKGIFSSASEVIIWTCLSHANILPIRGIYIPAENLRRLCMVSEWMDNGDLVQYLTHFPDTPRIPLLHDIISGLQYLHGLDIVHADLKASSVLVSKTGRALLADFGLSRVYSTVATTTFGGTVNWMAPELITSEGEASTRESDVWSFGCVCYEVSTGMTPFYQYKRQGQVLAAFFRGDTPLKPNPRQGQNEPNEITMDPQIQPLAERCWDYDPKRRPTSDELQQLFSLLNSADRRPLDPPRETMRPGFTKINYDQVYNILHQIHPTADVCRSLIVELVAPSDKLKLLTKLIDKDAQILADFLADLLKNPHSQLGSDDNSDNRSNQFSPSKPEREKKIILHVLVKLAKSAQVFPQWLELEGSHFGLNRPYARGGFGDIYKTVYKGKPACVKAIRLSGQSGDRQKLSALASELLSWAHLSHQNILPLYGIYLSSEKIPRACIVSMWMKNGNLLQYLNRFPNAPRVPLILDIISGLQHLHENGVVHADLKAKNVLVSESHRAMLADFGISQSSMTSWMTPTDGASGRGTANWMAPEFFLRGDSASSRESDIWAFGCTCYEVLTGNVPFHQLPQAIDLIRALKTGNAVKPLKPSRRNEWDESKETVWSLVEPCFERDPKSRPTADVLKESITNLGVPDDRSLEPEASRECKVAIEVKYDEVYRILKGVQRSPVEAVPE